MLSYGSVNFSVSIYMAFSSYYLMMFCTDVALVPAATTAVLLLCYRLVSLFDDPFMGLVINRNHFRDGKYRPYIKWAALPFALGLAGFGLTPRIGPAARTFFAAFTLILCELSKSAISTAALSMLPYFAKDDKTRTKYVSFSNGSAIASFIVIGTFMLPMADFFGKGDRGKGFSAVLALLMAIVIPVLFNAYLRLKERYYGETPGKPAVRDLLSAIGRNKRLLLFFTGFCLYAVGNAFKSQIAYYYVTYNLGRPELLPAVIFAGLISPLAMQPLIPRLLSYAKKETLIVFGAFAASCASLSILAAGGSPAGLIVCITFYGLFTSLVANLAFAVTASFTDGIRLSQNINMSEILTAAMGLSSNLGSTVTSGVGPMVLAVSGYSALTAAQTQATLSAIKILFVICAATGLALSGLVFLLAFKKRNVKGCYRNVNIRKQNY